MSWSRRSASTRTLWRRLAVRCGAGAARGLGGRRGGEPASASPAALVGGGLVGELVDGRGATSATPSAAARDSVVAAGRWPARPRRARRRSRRAPRGRAPSASSSPCSLERAEHHEGADGRHLDVVGEARRATLHDAAAAGARRRIAAASGRSAGRRGGACSAGVADEAAAGASISAAGRAAPRRRSSIDSTARLERVEALEQHVDRLARQAAASAGAAARRRPPSRA